jgi:NAD(P)H-dependent FMN reductase
MTSARQVSGTISGSLRRNSINSAVLRAAAAAASRDGAVVVIDDSVRELPHFDPDLETEPPEPVLRFRAAWRRPPESCWPFPRTHSGFPARSRMRWTGLSGVAPSTASRSPCSTLPRRAAARMPREALDLVLRAHGADVAHYSMPLARSDRNTAGEVDSPRIIGELRAVVAELAKRSSAAHESNADW